jgi:predicted nucleic acid-binding Zn ribbon protein
LYPGHYNLFGTATAISESQEKCGKDAAEIVTRRRKRVPADRLKAAGISHYNGRRKKCFRVTTIKIIVVVVVFRTQDVIEP